MAISTFGTFLMYKPTNSETYEKLIDIRDFPDIGGAREMLETTTLSNYMKTYIPGIEDSKALEFTANYDDSDYRKLKLMEDTEIAYSVWIGCSVSGGTVTPTGAHGKFSGKGQLGVYLVAGGTNDVVSMKITIVPSTMIAIENE